MPTGLAAVPEPALRHAAEAAVRAPSIFNTQPWRWRLSGGALELWADRGRQLASTDPDGRMLTVSCGAALDHALVGLAAEGCAVDVRRLVTPDLLARITLAGRAPAGPDARRLRDAVDQRHTDRRPFADARIPDAAVEVFRLLAEVRGVYLAELDADRLIGFQVTAARAGELDRDDPAYLAELAKWTHRAGPDGISRRQVVPSGPRRVPLRSFFPDGGERLLPGPGADRGARYLVLWTRNDDPEAWLAAGEAMSAILLAATVAGLGVSPMTDVVEVASSRARLHRLLDNLGAAQVVLRVGVPADGEVAPAAARRAVEDVLETEAPC